VNIAAIALKTDLHEIQPLRALFLQETNFQIRYNACHERGWMGSYLPMVDDLKVGDGSIKGLSAPIYSFQLARFGARTPDRLCVWDARPPRERRARRSSITKSPHI
jgi:hypothetical protein